MKNEKVRPKNIEYAIYVNLEGEAMSLFINLGSEMYTFKKYK